MVCSQELRVEAHGNPANISLTDMMCLTRLLFTRANADMYLLKSKISIWSAYKEFCRSILFYRIYRTSSSNLAGIRDNFKVTPLVSAAHARALKITKFIKNLQEKIKI